MSGKGFLLVGILAVVGIVLLTLAIIAVAPYIALLLVFGLLVWWICKESPDEKPP